MKAAKGNRNYEVVFKKSAFEELQSVPARIRDQVLDSIQFLAINPFTEVLQIKKLKGLARVYRLRVQDYRVIYEVDTQTIKIVIIKIGHRKEVYD